MNEWMKQGVYRLLDIGLKDSGDELIKWTSKDKEFEKIYQKRIKSGESREVKIAVLDCGVSKRGYLGHRGQIGGFYKPEGIMDKGKQGAHGTFVAGRAGWGTEKIKIFDAKIGHSHEFSSFDMQVVQEAMDHAINTWEIDIICCSVTLRYDKEVKVTIDAAQKVMTLGEYITSQEKTLFVLTSSNAPGTIFPYKSNLSAVTKRGVGGFPPQSDHILCVGGCTREGKLHVESRWGALDIWAPSGLFLQFMPEPALEGGGGQQELPAGKKRFGVDLSGIDEKEEKAEDKQSRVDRGVSFAVPMVANVAAKLKLLNPDRSAKALAKIVKSTSRVTQRTVSQDIINRETIRQKQTVRMLDPVAAYSFVDYQKAALYFTAAIIVVLSSAGVWTLLNSDRLD